MNISAVSHVCKVKWNQYFLYQVHRQTRTEDLPWWVQGLPPGVSEGNTSWTSKSPAHLFHFSCSNTSVFVCQSRKYGPQTTTKFRSLCSATWRTPWEKWSSLISTKTRYARSPTFFPPHFLNRFSSRSFLGLCALMEKKCFCGLCFSDAPRVVGVGVRCSDMDLGLQHLLPHR